MSRFYDLFLKNWSVCRVVRMLSGAMLVAFGIYSGDGFLATLGGLFILMGLFSVSCCTAGTCGTASEKKALYKDFVKPYDADKKRGN